MRIIHPDQLEVYKDKAFPFPDDLKGGVVLLGNFDGVHKGHREVIKQAQSLAQSHQTKLLMLSFEPHPKEFFNPQGVAFRLTPLSIKQKILKELGIDGLIILPFDNLLAGIEAQNFIQKLLIDTLCVAAVVVGHDFCFGHNRRGNAELLRQTPNFKSLIISPQTNQEGQIYASTKVREALLKGDLKAVKAMLMRPYEMRGQVIKGRQLGRMIGFPTANLNLFNQQRPKFGVYAVYGRIDDREHRLKGIANYGVKPTIGGDFAPIFEVYFFDFSDDIYDHFIDIELIHFIRDERKFDGIEALKSQIQKDCDIALNWL